VSCSDRLTRRCLSTLKIRPDLDLIVDVHAAPRASEPARRFDRSSQALTSPSLKKRFDFQPRGPVLRTARARRRASRAPPRRRAPTEATLEPTSAVAHAGRALVRGNRQHHPQQLGGDLPTVIRRDQGHIFKSASPRESGGYVALMMVVPSIAELRSLIADFVLSLTRRSD
jgi:hypothetical protein